MGGRAADGGTFIGIHGGAINEVVHNNIVLGGGGAHDICIGEYGAGHFSELSHNDVSGCATLYLNYAPTSGTCEGGAYDCLTDIASLNDAAAIGVTTADGNVALSPGLVDAGGDDDEVTTLLDNDWHLAADAPVNLRLGGMSLEGSFTGDRDTASNKRTDALPDAAECGVTATCPDNGGEGWSIGAYERD